MRSKIKLSGDCNADIQMLIRECKTNNQICYHIGKNQNIIKYLEAMTGLNGPVMVLFYHYKEGIKDIPKCICGKDRQYHCYGYRPTCGDRKCQSEVREISKKATCMEKYGVEFVTQLDSMKERSKEALMLKYGVDNATKSPEVIDKRRRSNLQKYGVTDTLMLKSVRGNEKVRGLEFIQKGLPTGFKILKNDNTYYSISCPKNHKFTISKHVLFLRKKHNTELCSFCLEYIGSKGEQDVFSYISSIYSGNISRSNRTLIKPFELDMVIDELKICIEFNGDYWHSDKIVEDQYYHLNKLNMCLLKGYKLLQIRENDWNKNSEVIKRKLYNIINGIVDMNDFEVVDGKLRLDLSWYDDRLISEDKLVDVTLPQLIKVGQYNQWNCGYKNYTITDR